MKPNLPQWAADIMPLNIDQAALVLGISRTYLRDFIKLYPHYELRGRKKLFYPEHIEALRQEWRPVQSPKPSSERPLRVARKKNGESDFERALKLANEKK